jgi:hypothetical protein
VRTYLERLRKNFLEAEPGVDSIILLITEQGELTNMNHSLLITDISELTLQSGEDTLLIEIIHR